MARQRQKRQREKRARLGGYDPLVEWLGLNDTGSTGQVVNEASAMRLSVYYACIKVVSEDVGKLPLILYQREGRGKVRADNHPMYRLLRVAPNPAMTAMTFREVLTAHALNYGNGYAEISWNGENLPAALWPIDPTTVSVKVLPNGLPIYEIRKLDGGVQTITSENMLHIHGPGFDGLQGYSVARAARDSVGAGLAAQDFAGRFFGNSARPSGILQHPGKLSDKAYQNLKASFAGAHSRENALKPFIAEEGMTWHPLTISPEDAQFLETRQWHVEDICRWFRVPPEMIGHMLRAQGWSTAETRNQVYLDGCLSPWLVRWEQEIERKLISDRRRDLICEHLVEGMLRTDIDKRYTAYAVAVTNGWLNRNEVRERENMNPAADLDEYLVPLNMQTTTDAKKAAEMQQQIAVQMQQPQQEQEPPDEQQDEEDDEEKKARAIRQAITVNGPPSDTSTTGGNPVIVRRDMLRDPVREAFASLLSQAFERVLRADSDRIRSAMAKGSPVESLRDAAHEAARSAVHPIMTAYAHAIGIREGPELGATITTAATHYIEWTRRELDQTGDVDALLEHWREEARSNTEAYIAAEMVEMIHPMGPISCQANAGS